jgi:hypothetical protein
MSLLLQASDIPFLLPQLLIGPVFIAFVFIASVFIARVAFPAFSLPSRRSAGLRKFADQRRSA